MQICRYRGLCLCECAQFSWLDIFMYLFPYWIRLIKHFQDTCIQEINCYLCIANYVKEVDVFRSQKTIMPPYLRIKETSTLSIKRRRGLNVLVKNFKKCGTIYCILKKIIKSTLNFALKWAYYKNVSFQSSCSSFTYVRY